LLIVFIHGGTWEEGSKDDYLFVGEAFASKGYHVLVPNYRLYPDVAFPGFVEDGAGAIA
jgi:acetyl esterase/lipase